MGRAARLAPLGALVRASVRDAFFNYNLPFEGGVPFFYQDVKGLVSIGVGILADPIELAQELPLVRQNGTPATRAEIVVEWRRIKALGSGDITEGNPAARGGHIYAKPHTTLRLTQEGLRSTLEAKAAQMDAYLTGRFPGYPAWPADAQLGVMSHSWANGPAFRYPKMVIALNSRDFRTAGVESHISELNNPGVRPRNAAQRVLFRNAAIVEEAGLDPDVLYYPKDLDGAPIGPDDNTIPAPSPPVIAADFAIVHPPVFPGDDDPDPAA